MFIYIFIIFSIFFTIKFFRIEVEKKVKAKAKLKIKMKFEIKIRFGVKIESTDLDYINSDETRLDMEFLEIIF